MKALPGRGLRGAIALGLLVLLVFALLRYQTLGSAVATPTSTANSAPSSTPVLTASGPTYSVVIGEGLHPSLSHEQVANRALERIASMERRLGRRLAEPQILSVEATTFGRLSSAVQEGVIVEGSELIWLVKARGTFIPYFGAPDASSDNGYWLMNDSGSIITFGFPIPPDLMP